MYTNKELDQAFEAVQEQTSYTAQDVRTARQKWLDAQQATAAIDQEIKRPVWRSKQDHDTLRNQLNQAKQDEDQAYQHFNTVFAKAGWLEAQEKRHAREAVQEQQRKEDQAKRAASMEQETKEEFEQRWLGNGGTSEDFQKAWPGMYQQLLIQRTMEGQNAMVDAMRKSGQYEL